MQEDPEHTHRGIPWQLIVVLVLLTTLICGTILIYLILSYFLSRIISLIIIIILLKQLCVAVCRFVVFPGHLSIFQKVTQNQFRTSLAKRSLLYMTTLSDLLYYIRQKSEQRSCSTQSMDTDRLSNMSEWLRSQLATYNFVYDTYHATKDQEVYLQTLIKMKLLISKTQLNLKGQTINFEQFLRQPITHITLMQVAGQETQISDLQAYSELESHVKFAIELVQTCLATGTKERLNNFFKNSMFGSLNELRAYIAQVHFTQRIQFQSFDGCKLDCLIISSVSNKFHEHPVMMICNPNGACYETLYHNTHWPEYYLRQGINVLLWNYRGYGQSEGVPNPKVTQLDGEAIIDHLRINMKCKRIGVHGYSLGGQVACQIACTKSLDFLFADRTFMSLSSVGEESFGKKLSVIFNVVTNWNSNVYQDYIDFQGEKCIGVDPNDEIIPFNASLSVGVANQMFIQNYKKNAKDISSNSILQHACNYIQGSRLFSSFIQGNQLLKCFYQSIMVEGEFEEFYVVSQRLISHLLTLVHQDPDSFSKVLIKPYEEDSKTQSPSSSLQSLDVSDENFLNLFNDRKYKELFLNLYYILTHLDNGFQTYSELFANGAPNKQSLMSFFIAGHIWMQPSSLQQSWLIFDEKVTQMIAEYSSDNLVSKIMKDLRCIKNKTKVILDNLYSRPRENADNLIEMFETQEQIRSPVNELGFTQYVTLAIGEVFTVRCGHNGSYNYEELLKYQKILSNSGLMQKQLK